MNECSKFEELCALNVDGELANAQKQELQAHIACCPSCRSLYKELEKMHEMTREVLEMPSALHTIIMSAVSLQAVHLPKKKVPSASASSQGVAGVGGGVSAMSIGVIAATAVIAATTAGIVHNYMSNSVGKPMIDSSIVEQELPQQFAVIDGETPQFEIILPDEEALVPDLPIGDMEMNRSSGSSNAGAWSENIAPSTKAPAPEQKSVPVPDTSLEQKADTPEPIERDMRPQEDKLKPDEPKPEEPKPEEPQPEQPDLEEPKKMLPSSSGSSSGGGNSGNTKPPVHQDEPCAEGCLCLQLWKEYEYYVSIQNAQEGSENLQSGRVLSGVTGSENSQEEAQSKLPSLKFAGWRKLYACSWCYEHQCGNHGDLLETPQQPLPTCDCQVESCMCAQVWSVCGNGLSFEEWHLTNRCQACRDAECICGQVLPDVEVCDCGIEHCSCVEDWKNAATQDTFDLWHNAHACEACIAQQCDCANEVEPPQNICCGFEACFCERIWNFVGYNSSFAQWHKVNICRACYDANCPCMGMISKESAVIVVWNDVEFGWGSVIANPNYISQFILYEEDDLGIPVQSGLFPALADCIMPELPQGEEMLQAPEAGTDEVLQPSATQENTPTSQAEQNADSEWLIVPLEDTAQAKDMGATVVEPQADGNTEHADLAAEAVFDESVRQDALEAAMVSEMIIAESGHEEQETEPSSIEIEFETETML